MKHFSTDKIILLVGCLVFASGAVSLYVNSQQPSAAGTTEGDGLNQVGVDLAQGSRSRLLSTRMQAQAEGKTVYTIELETNAKP